MNSLRTTLALLRSVGGASAAADDALWESLREPDRIVFLRHTQAKGDDPLAWDETGACHGERRLTRYGETQARQIGAHFRARGIRPLVYSSPLCRCRDTARLAFGDYTADARLREVPNAESVRADEFLDAVRRLARQHRGNERPLLIVSHRPNIDLVTMELVDVGEALIGKIAHDGDIEVIGRLALVDAPDEP